MGRAGVASVRAFAFAAVSIVPLAAPSIGGAQAGEGAAAGRRGADTLSLPTPRPLKFTTDEGTWMSVDVSPDGKTLVFDLLGDLYTLPVAGGAATRITRGQAFDATPRFSPDGKSIAFVSDRTGSSNLWIAGTDGSRARALSRTERFTYVSPTWAPDGKAVLVSRNNALRNGGAFDLYLYHLDGGSGQRLTGTTPAAAPAGPPAPGAGGANSFFGARFSAPRTVWYSTSGQTAQLFTLDLETGQRIRRTNARAGAVRPIPSPDGRWLVYTTRHNDVTALRLRDLTTGDERWLLDNAQHDQLSGQASRDLMPGMSFTPDSRALITSYGGKFWRVAIPSGESTPIPFTAEVDQMIAASTQFSYALDDSVLTVRQIRVPRLSPDGKRVAFVALDRVWVADLPSTRASGQTAQATNIRRVTRFDLSEYGPAWSPDGQWLSFVTWDDSTGGDIYRVRVAGSGAAAATPQRISPDKAYYEKLTYTPDGSKLLFARISRADRFETDELGFGGPAGTDADLMWMPAAGGAAKFITRLEYLDRLNPPTYGVPHFGRDSSRVLIYEAADNGLYSMRLDGTDRRFVFRATEVPWNSQGEDAADDIVLSPTDDRVALLGMQNIYLARTNPSGTAPTVSLANGGGTASVPMRRITRIGGNFVSWNADGKTLLYSLGPSLFLYDVEAADSAFAAAPDTARARFMYQPARVDITIRVPKDRPSGTVVLRGARVITMKGDEVLENADIVVRGNRIAGVGARGSVSVPNDARVIDLGGKTIVPGFVDTHAHMYAPGWGLHRTELWQYYANLAYGVTSSRDPQTMTTDVIDYADRVETGDMIGPRVYSTARGFFDQEEINSLEDARNALRRNSEFLKTETIKQYLVGDRKRRQWVAQAALEQRLSPTNEGGADFALNLTHMMDGYAGEEHTLPTYPLYKDVVQLAVASEITYTPVLIVAYGGPNVQEYFTSRFDMRAEPRTKRFWPRSFMEARTFNAQWRPDELYAFPKLAAEAAKIAAAGGRVGVGSHGNLQGIGYHFEMWALAMGGMAPRDVLRSATLVGARAIGHAQDFGSIEIGKLADLVVLDANPLENIRNTNSIRYVMKNGRLYDGLTLDESWPRQRKLPTTQWWMARERQ